MIKPVAPIRSQIPLSSSSARQTIAQAGTGQLHERPAFLAVEFPRRHHFPGVRPGAASRFPYWRESVYNDTFYALDIRRVQFVSPSDRFRPQPPAGLAALLLNPAGPAQFCCTGCARTASLSTRRLTMVMPTGSGLDNPARSSPSGLFYHRRAELVDRRLNQPLTEPGRYEAETIIPGRRHGLALRYLGVLEGKALSAAKYPGGSAAGAATACRWWSDMHRPS